MGSQTLIENKIIKGQSLLSKRDFKVKWNELPLRKSIFC